MPSWSNLGQNVSVVAHRLSKPGGYDDARVIIEEALRLGRHVHPVGRGWSYTDAATTGDFLIDTRGIRGILAFSQGRRVWGHRIVDRDTPDDRHVEDDPLPAAGYPPDRSWALVEALRDDVAATDRRLVHVAAGTTIRELYEALDNPGRDLPVGTPGARGRWALPTMGGASGQTVAGAIGTGTHGGDFDAPPMADMVRAIHLIAPDGTQRWIEPAAGAITDPVRLHTAMRGHVAREHIHHDDDLFAAALVSLGALGLIYTLVLEVRAQYGLHEVVQPRTTWRAIRASLVDGTIFGAPGRPPAWLATHPAPRPSSPPRPDDARIAKSLGLFINPYRADGNYDTGDGHDQRSVTLITQAEARNDFAAVTPAPTPTSTHDLMLAVLGFEAASSPAGTAGIVQQILDKVRVSGRTPGYAVAWSALDTTAEMLPVLSLEIVVTTTGGRHVTLLDEMFAAFDRVMREKWRAGIGAKLAGAFAIRFTQPTRALLGMQAATGAAGERFCHIEIPIFKELDIFLNAHQGHAAMENFSEDFVVAFEQVAARLGARMHWGQLSLTGLHRADRYAGMARFLAARDKVTRGGAVNTFDNAFTTRAGLVRAPAGWAIRSGMIPAPPAMGTPTATQPQARMPVTVAMNPVTQCNELYAIAGEGQVARARQLRPSSGWNEWELLPANFRFVLRPAVAIARDWSYVFARTAEGLLLQTNSPVAAPVWQSSTWGGFHGYQVVGSPAAVVDQLHGWPYVAARCADGRIRCVSLARHGTRPGHFGSWEDLPALPQPALGDPVLAVGGDGRFGVYVRCGDGGVWTTPQPADGGYHWATPWQRIGTGQLSADPIVARHGDGHLEIFGRGLDGRLWHTWQDRPGGTWAAWQHHGQVTDVLASGARLSWFAADGVIAIAMRDANSRIHVAGFGHGQRWHDRRLDETITAGPTIVADPAIGASADGRLELFTRMSHDLVLHRWESRLGEW